MVRRPCGRTLLYRIPNTVIRNSLGVASVIEKLRKYILRWFGHVHRRQTSEVIRRVLTITIEGVRRRVCPMIKWEDNGILDLKRLALTEDMTLDRKK